MTPDWLLRDELGDVLREQQRRRKRRCIFCGALTQAQSGVCLDHDDLPALDPDLNREAEPTITT